MPYDPFHMAYVTSILSQIWGLGVVDLAPPRWSPTKKLDDLQSRHGLFAVTKALRASVECRPQGAKFTKKNRARGGLSQMGVRRFMFVKTGL